MLTKEQIKKLRENLEQELLELEKRNREKVNEMEHPGETDTFHGDEADQATYLEQRSRLLRLRDRDRKLINKIQKTISKLENGNYGTCDSCGIDIPYERLKLRPVADLCIECKQAQEEREERDKLFKGR
jgi:DnaK suppressor protein